MFDLQLIWEWILKVGSILGILLTILKIWEHAFSKPKFYLANDEIGIDNKNVNKTKVKYDFYVINTGRKGLVKIYFEIKPEQSSNTLGLNIPIAGWMSINKHSERRVKGELELNKYISTNEIKFPLKLVVNLCSIKKSIYKQGYWLNGDGSGSSIVGPRTIY